MEKQKVILIIRDGWGYRKDCNLNSICETQTPITDNLMKIYPNTLLNASGEAVGLPKGYQGNSEVGHMTIGSGRIMFQSLPKINQAIESGEFFKNKEFVGAINNCKQNNSHLHLIGLLQSEGVHAHEDHLFALLDLCKQENFNEVYIHVITDGRDAPITDSLKHIAKLKQKISEIGFGKIVTVSGRYYAMDRDTRWDRTEKAYNCIINGEGESFLDVEEQIKLCHKNNETDEFIIPRKDQDYSGINDNDSFIFFNFRTDRPRQLTRAIVEDNFSEFERQKKNIFYVAMTQFYQQLNARVAFKDDKINSLLGEIISKNNLNQLRISETEKYAHVTFFFNGQIEKPFEKEDRILIPSPNVATYDLKPEMSVYEIKDKLLENIETEKYDLIVTNLVNGDMVGHTGITEAIHKAVAAVDDCIGKIVEKGLENNYTILVFADHGNAEDQTEKWRTSHTTNPVPFLIISKNEDLKHCKLKENCGLQDIAPTVLKLLKIDKPAEMSDDCIIEF